MVSVRSAGDFALTRAAGFARISKWQYEGEATGLAEGSAGIVLSLEPTDEIKAIYKPDFKLLYTVSLDKKGSLTTALETTNPSSSENLRFQTLCVLL